jgi:hypothetical protein
MFKNIFWERYCRAGQISFADSSFVAAHSQFAHAVASYRTISSGLAVLVLVLRVTVALAVQYAPMLTSECSR